VRLVEHIKWRIKALLESHPIGYAFGIWIINVTDAFLPHEEDYHGFKKLVTADQGLFLDIGANDGKTVRSFRKLFNNWQVFSVEANALHQPALQKLKSKLKNFDFVIGAIGEQDKPLTLYTPIYKKIVIHSAASIDLAQVKRQMKKQFRKESVVAKIHYEVCSTPRIHLDDLNLAPEIIKIDIEGMEHIAVQALAKTITKTHPIILLEYNPSNFAKISDYLLARDYLACGFNLPLDKFEKFNQHRNCFFIPAAKKSLVAL
jgi:FkbM family methyltransferase